MLRTAWRITKLGLIPAAVFGIAGCAMPLIQQKNENAAEPAPVAVSKPGQTGELAPIAKPQHEPAQLPISGTRDDIWERIRQGYQLGHEKDPAVDNLVTWYADNHSVIAQSSKRAAPIIYHIVETVEAFGLPTELALIPLLESGYRVHARSRFGAVGPWQFMPATGRQYGLQRSAFIDDRRDIVLSTKASLTYLRDLHRQFRGDWLLAIAAYNSGPGNVRKALRGSRKTFWQIASKLPNETREYVPKLLAAARIIGNPEAFKQQLHAIPNEPFFETVEVVGPVDFAVLDLLPNWDPKLFRRLNGGLSSTYFGNATALQIRVPRGQGISVSKHLANAVPPTIPDLIRYKVLSGDTLGRLAIQFNVPIADLRKINGIHGNNIRAGKHLLVPVATNPTTGSENAQSQSQKYIIKPGDTFWTIGRRYGLSARTLASYNGCHINTTLYPGHLLIIPSAGAEKIHESTSSLSAYIVERGDSLWSIAKRFSIRLTDLKKWNPIVGGNLLRPGQKLLVQAPRIR